MKKILFATYPMAFHTVGGGEVQLRAYANALGRKGITVEFLDMWNPNFKNYDLVHFFSCVGGSYNFCHFIKSLEIPLVVSSSLWITPGTEKSYPIADIIDQLNVADRIVTNSNLESDLLARTLNIDINKFSHVYNGYDKSILNYYRQNLNKVKGMVLNVGNIELRKNQLNLARALKNIPGATLHLAGGVRDKEYFSEIMKEMHGRIVYHGVLPANSKELMELYSQCDVFILPSFLETPGLAAIEAYVMGANVVVTNEGSAREYFEDNVIYINPNKINSIECGIRDALVDLEYKKIERAKFRENFEWGDVTNRLVNIYNEVINDIN